MVIPTFTSEEYHDNVSDFHAGAGGVTMLVALSLAGVAAAAVPLVVRAQAATRPYQMAREFGRSTWHNRSDTVTGVLLALPWLFVAMFFYSTFTSLSKYTAPVAFVGSSLALGQAAFLVVMSAVRPDSGGLTWRSKTRNDWVAWLGAATCMYAVCGHMVVEWLLGHPVVGLGLPTPTCILMVGVFLLGDGAGVPLMMLALPTLWAVLWLPTVYYLELWADAPLLPLLLFAFMYLAFTQPVVAVGDPRARARARTLHARQAARAAGGAGVGAGDRRADVGSGWRTGKPKAS